MKIDLDFFKWKPENDIRHFEFSVPELRAKFRLSVTEMEDGMFQVAMQRGNSNPYLYIAYDRKGVIDLLELFLSDFTIGQNRIDIGFPEWYENDYLLQDCVI